MQKTLKVNEDIHNIIILPDTNLKYIINRWAYFFCPKLSYLLSNINIYMGFNSAPGSGMGNGPAKTTQEKSARREDVKARIEDAKEELKKLAQKMFELNSDLSVDLEKAKIRGSVEQEKQMARADSKRATQEQIDNLKAEIKKLEEEYYF